MMVTTDGRAARHSAERAVGLAGGRFEWIGRAGWLAKGAVYALIGVLFVRIALGGSGGEEANQTGAVQQVAESGPGAALLVVLCVGFALYVVWRLFTVALPGDWTGRALLERIGYAVSAVSYGSLLVTTVGILRNRSAQDQQQDNMVEGLVKDVLEMTAGRLLVGAAGLGVIALGVAFAHRGWTHGFRDDISGDRGIENTAIDRLGVIGWIARGLSMGLIGVFLVRAAWTFDPDEAAGLDDSIRQVAANPLGAILAAVVGVGFVAYGAFAAVSARHRDLRGPVNS